MRSRIHKRRLSLNWSDHIYESCSHSQFLLERSLEDIKICSFKILTEKFGRNLDRQS